MKKILTGVLFIVMAVMFFGCDDDNETSKPALPDNSSTTAISKNNRVIYEVNVRNFSAEGTFEGLKNDLPRLKELGVDILWLMPIHPIGIENRDGVLGSMYSVKDYKDVNPEFGTLNDFKSLVNAAHGNGMEIWLDWVANHTAWDHPWVTEHISYYARSSSGQRPYSPENWLDVVQLDYNNTEMRAAMIDAMKYWVSETNIDGFRCDAATYVPSDFWRQARAEVDAVKRISWLAEADDTRYISIFDMDYAWGFNATMNEFGKGNINTLDLRAACWNLFYNDAYSDKQKMVYLTNHDLNAYDGTEFTRYRTKVKPLTVLSFTLYDMPLIYNGQEIGYNKALSMNSKDRIIWQNSDDEINDLMKRLTYLKRTTPALESGAGRGTLYHYDMQHEDIYAYSRAKGNSRIVVVLNFSDKRENVTFDGNYPEGLYEDYLNGGTIEFSNGKSVSMAPYGYAVYIKK